MKQISGIIFVILFTATVWAGSINDLTDSWKGKDAYKKGDYKTALEIWKTQAEQGNARSSFLLGRLYEMGQGATKNQDEAIKWYERSAKLGDSEAQWWLCPILFPTCNKCYLGLMGQISIQSIRILRLLSFVFQRRTMT